MILSLERAAAALLAAAAISAAPGRPGAPVPAGPATSPEATTAVLAFPAPSREAAPPGAPPAKSPAAAESGSPALSTRPAGSSVAGWTALDPPAGPGAMAHRLTTIPGGPTGEKGLLLSWIEPEAPAAPAAGAGRGPQDSAVQAAGRMRRLRLARLGEGGWSAPLTITSGTDFFANWADVPVVGVAPRVGWVAAWLYRSGPGIYDYSIHLARSADEGATWTPAGMLHEPGPGEHGFVALVPESSGVRALFLQGTEEKGTALRTAVVPAEGAARPPEVVDPLACDCCPVDAALAAGGLVVAYRDRSPEEVRDVYVVRRTAAGWSRPVAVGRDGWRIPGCPVNGPAVVAAGREVAVAWFTAAPPKPRIQVAFSRDGGATFGPAVTVDDDAPLGRVTLAPAAGTEPGLSTAGPKPGLSAGRAGPGEVVVGWLASAGEKRGRATVTLRRVAPSGATGAPLAVAGTGAARASGIPRIARHGSRLVVAWVEDGSPYRLRAGSLPLAAVPPVRPAGPSR